MEITRTINGKETTITLTDDELRAAYYEQEYDWMKEDLECRYEVSGLSDSDIEDVVTQIQDDIASSDGFREAYWAVFRWVAEKNEIKEKDEY